MLVDPAGAFIYHAVIQLYFFFIYLAFGFIICWRHLLRRSEAWVHILVTLSILLRILGASFQLVTIKNHTDLIYGAALICEGIGLALLTLLNIGLFARVNELLVSVHHMIYFIISLFMMTGIVLVSWGSPLWTGTLDQLTNFLLKASVILFLASYLAFVCLFLICFGQWKAIPPGEQKLLTCFAYCVPFIAIRFIFGILRTFVESFRDEHRALSVSLFLCMTVIQEIFVVAFFIFTFMNLERLPSTSRAGAQFDDSTWLSHYDSESEK